MNVENTVFGEKNENKDINNTESNFDFNRKKDVAKINIEKSAAALEEFLLEVTQDVPEPTEEEVKAGIAKILEKAELVEAEHKPETEPKHKRIIVKVLFMVALIAVLSVSCLWAVGSKHNISIENGFVTFAKDTVYVVLFGNSKEEYIPISALFIDLEAHGYENITLPESLSSGNYKASIPEYSDDDFGKQVTFTVYNDQESYDFSVYPDNEENQMIANKGLNNIETIITNGKYVYLFEYGNGLVIEYIYDDYCFFIETDASYSDTVKVAQSIK